MHLFVLFLEGMALVLSTRPVWFSKPDQKPDQTSLQKQKKEDVVIKQKTQTRADRQQKRGIESTAGHFPKHLLYKKNLVLRTCMYSYTMNVF